MTSHLAYLSDRAYIYFNFPLVNITNLFILFYFIFYLDNQICLWSVYVDMGATEAIYGI